MSSIPPCIAGWRVLTLPPNISGAPVTSDTSLSEKKLHIYDQLAHMVFNAQFLVLINIIFACRSWKIPTKSLSALF